MKEYTYRDKLYDYNWRTQMSDDLVLLSESQHVRFS